MLLSHSGKQSEAEAEYRKAIALYQKLADDYPAVTQYRSDLASCLNNLGLLLNHMGRQSESEAEFRKATRSQSGWPTTTPPSPRSAISWQ